MNKRMDRTRLNIGTYFLQPYARTEQHVKDLKACGIDFVLEVNCDKPLLDLFEKYGVGAVVNEVLPPWWGGDGDNAGKMAENCPLEKYAEAAEAFTDHPAIWGVDTGDEPSARDFPHYGKVTTLTEKLFPRQFAYLNLYPNYASVAQNNAQETVNQLGTATYDEHIDVYDKQVGLDYLCYDFYMYSLRKEGKPFFGMDRAYENLRCCAESCRKSGRALWIVLQVNSSFPREWISENQLRFQAFSAMAFGVEVITWGCYTAGWWHNQVLDEAGEKTQQYDKLANVNAEIHAIASSYMKYRCTDTAFIGFAGASRPETLKTAPVDALDTGVFHGVKQEGGDLIAGRMVARDGSGKQALFLCNANDPLDRDPSVGTVTFSADRPVRIETPSGEVKPEVLPDGRLRFPLAASACALIMAE